MAQWWNRWVSRAASLRADNDALQKEVAALTKERDRLHRELHGSQGHTSIEGLLIDAKSLVQKAKTADDPFPCLRAAMECVVAYLDKGGERK